MSPENTNLKTKLLFSVSFFVTFCLFCTNNKEMKHFNNNCKWQWKNESFLASTSIAKCWLQTLDRAENFGLKIGVHCGDGDDAQVGVLEQTDQVGLAGLLQSADGGGLEPEISF